MDLEDKVSFFHGFVRPVSRWLVEHPKTSGVFGYFASLVGTACVSTAQNNPSPGNNATHVGVGLGTYWGLKLVNEYILGNRDVVEPEEKKGFLGKIRNYINKIEYAIFNNPAFTAFIPGAVAYLYLNYSFKGLTKTETPEEYLFLIPSLYPPSHLMLNMRKANEFFTRTYDKLKSKNPILRFSDFILEKPMISAGFVGLGFFYYRLNSFEWAMQNEPVSGISLASLLSFFPACAAYAVHTVAAGLFHSSSLKLVFKNLRIGVDKLLGNYDSAIDKLEDLLEIPTSPDQKARIHVKIADMYAKKGEIDCSLLNIKQAIELSGEKKTVFNPFDWLRELLYVDKITDHTKNLIDESKKDSVAKTRQSVFYFKRKKYDYAIAKIDKAISLSPDNPSFRIIKAMELDVIKKYDEANNVWLGILPKIHKDFERISNSSKEVFQITSNVLADDFIFSRSSDVDALKIEYGFSRFVYDCYTDKQKIPNPLAFLDLSESDFNQDIDKDLLEKPAYFVNSRIKGEVLADTDINESIILKVLESYFDFVARTTAQRDRLGEYSVNGFELDYDEIFIDKFIKRLPFDRKTREIVFTNFDPVMHYLLSKERSLIHGNFHSRNVIKGNSYCIIDFGDMRFGLDTLGIGQLSADLNFNIEAKLRIYQACSNFGYTERCGEEFVSDCVFASVFSAAHLLGRSYKYKEGNISAYQKNLVDNLDILMADSFVNRPDKNKIKRFKEALCSLQFNCSLQLN